MVSRTQERLLAGGESHPTEAVALLVEGSWGEILWPVSPPALQAHPMLAGPSRKPGAKGAIEAVHQGRLPGQQAGWRRVGGKWRESKQFPEVTQPVSDSRWAAYSPIAVLSLGRNCREKRWCGKGEAARGLVTGRTFPLMETSPNVSLC